MQPEKWQEIKTQIKNAFADAEFLEIETDEFDHSERESIIFTGQLGKMKLEYITRPVVLDKKTHGSRRIGSHTDVEYIYSETEFSHQLKAYKWNDTDSDWLEIDMKGSFNI
ncbi:MAG: hypothetical protein WCP18_04400 [bacterium]